jgi:hypothetical protein
MTSGSYITGGFSITNACCIASAYSMTRASFVIGCSSITGGCSIAGFSIIGVVGIGATVAATTTAAWAAMTSLPMRSWNIMYKALANRSMVDMSTIKILASSFSLANTTLLVSFATLSIVAQASNLAASTFSLSSFNFYCCVSIISFELALDLLCVFLELVLINSTIKVIDASILLVVEDPASFSALSFLWLAGWPADATVEGINPSLSPASLRVNRTSSYFLHPSSFLKQCMNAKSLSFFYTL